MDDGEEGGAGEEEEDLLGLKKKKRKEKETDAQLQQAVESMVAKVRGGFYFGGGVFSPEAIESGKRGALVGG